MANSTPFNPLARAAASFKAECNRVEMEHWLSKDNDIHLEPDNLSALMFDFKEVRMKEDYVLDGFLTGRDAFGYAFQLHAHRKDAVEFLPPDWHVIPGHLSEEEQLARLSQWEEFRDDMYIRHGIRSDDLRHLPFVPMMSALEVPFTGRGIWEATLLLVAPHMLPCFWHAYYNAYEIICSDSNLSKRAPKNKFIGTDITHPKVIIEGEEATVLFTEWGWNGLRQHMLEVRKAGDGVRFVRDVATYLELQKEIRYL